MGHLGQSGICTPHSCSLKVPIIKKGGGGILWIHNPKPIGLSEIFHFSKVRFSYEKNAKECIVLLGLISCKKLEKGT